MLKIVEASVVFAEFPDEVSLALSVSNCPNNCKGCSEAYLKEDIGKELTEELLDKLINDNRGVTLVGFMGGDCDHESVARFANLVHEKYGLKVGMYSGRDYIDLNLATVLDYYKIGRWKMFEGDESTWKNQCAGPLSLPVSNQVMFKRVDDKLIDITEKFRRFPINNWKSLIIN